MSEWSIEKVTEQVKKNPTPWLLGGVLVVGAAFLFMRGGAAPARSVVYPGEADLPPGYGSLPSGGLPVSGGVTMEDIFRLRSDFKDDLALQQKAINDLLFDFREQNTAREYDRQENIAISNAERYYSNNDAMRTITARQIWEAGGSTSGYGLGEWRQTGEVVAAGLPQDNIMVRDSRGLTVTMPRSYYEQEVYSPSLRQAVSSYQENIDNVNFQAVGHYGSNEGGQMVRVDTGGGRIVNMPAEYYYSEYAFRTDRELA
jgi:hypothetical protein